MNILLLQHVMYGCKFTLFVLTAVLKKGEKCFFFLLISLAILSYNNLLKLFGHDDLENCNACNIIQQLCCLGSSLHRMLSNFIIY